MKRVILSADGDSVVYSVPDAVADHLEKYCEQFCSGWLWDSPQAEKYRKDFGGYQGVSFNEADFIEYLNKYRFPDTPSVFVENLGWTSLGEDLPEAYRDLPYFNF